MKSLPVLILIFFVHSTLLSQSNESNQHKNNFNIFISFGTSVFPFNSPLPGESPLDLGFREAGIHYKFKEKFYTGISIGVESYPQNSYRIIIPEEPDVDGYKYNSFSSLHFLFGYIVNNNISAGIKIGYPISSDYHSPYSLMLNSSFKVLGKGSSSLMLQPEIKFAMKPSEQSTPSVHLGLNLVFGFGV